MKACVIQCGRHCVEDGGEKDFHEFVRMWGLILSNPMVCSEYFVVRQIVMVEGYFELHYWKDLGLVMRVY